MNKTSIVLNASKFVERFSSSALSSLLDIDLATWKTLGNKGSTLSFKQKLDLLTDINSFDKKELRKFQTFTEIRNQFGHNFDVTDFESCLSFLAGTENFLTKQYSDITKGEKSQEQFLHELFNRLFNDIINTCFEILEAVKAKIKKDTGTEVTLEIYEELLENIKNYAEDNVEANPEFAEFYERTLVKMELKREA